MGGTKSSPRRKLAVQEMTDGFFEPVRTAEAVSVGQCMCIDLRLEKQFSTKLWLGTIVWN
jgi:hypothetical protein